MDTNGHTIIYEDYVSFETAKLLKEKGFDEFCPTFYETDEPDNGPKYSKKLGWFLHNSYDYSDRYGKIIISAPTLSMAMKWLRVVHKLEIYPYHQYSQDGNKWWFEIVKFPSPVSDYESNAIYATYEEACEAAIKYCLENLI